MTTSIVLIISALCGVGFGYAAQRGSLCVVSGIEALIEGQSPRVFLSFLRCSLWVIAITLPLAWAIEGDQLDRIAAPSFLTIAGGLAFGIGAAINGGCSFGTLIRLGSGDASFIATLAGLAFGFTVQRYAPGLDLSAPAIGRSLLEDTDLVGIAALVFAAAFCLRELWLDGTRECGKQHWSPERSAMVMGAAGGVLYALHGSWAYTLAIERGLAAMNTGNIPNLDLGLIFVACLAGAAIAARRFRVFRFRFNARDVPKHLLGGTVMGVAAALIPGGNDVLVLHALPALSPHAPVAYLALVVGAAGALFVSSRLRRRAAIE